VIPNEKETKQLEREREMAKAILEGKQLATWKGEKFM
jgi:hypothetical protein